MLLGLALTEKQLHFQKGLDVRFHNCMTCFILIWLLKHPEIKPSLVMCFLAVLGNGDCSDNEQ